MYFLLYLLLSLNMVRFCSVMSQLYHVFPSENILCLRHIFFFANLMGLGIFSMHVVINSVAVNISVYFVEHYVHCCCVCITFQDIMEEADAAKNLPSYHTGLHL